MICSDLLLTNMLCFRTDKYSHELSALQGQSAYDFCFRLFFLSVLNITQYYKLQIQVCKYFAYQLLQPNKEYLTVISSRKNELHESLSSYPSTSLFLLGFVKLLCNCFRIITSRFKLINTVVY